MHSLYSKENNTVKYMAQEEQGHKVFISYKYGDKNVQHLDRSGKEDTIVRHYVDEFQDVIGESVHVNKGEKDGEDMSDFKDSTIESKLRNKIYDSTVTVIFISPNMKTVEPEDDQWIPWEISYSLRVEHRENDTSYCNGVVAVVIPDKNGSYDYMLEKRNCEGCVLKCTTWHTGKLFTILRLNMFNKYKKNESDCKNDEKVYNGDHSYIKMVRWDYFINHYNDLIQEAFDKKDRRDDYDIKINVNG